MNKRDAFKIAKASFQGGIAPHSMGSVVVTQGVIAINLYGSEATLVLHDPDDVWRLYGILQAHVDRNMGMANQKAIGQQARRKRK